MINIRISKSILKHRHTNRTRNHVTPTTIQRTRNRHPTNGKLQRRADEKVADRLRVEASAQNKGAISFYRDNGFEDHTVIMEDDF